MKADHLSQLFLALLLLLGSLNAACGGGGSPIVLVPTTLSTPNTCNYLTASSLLLNDGINITATNITLDCDGFTISGLNTTGTIGVYSNSSYTNITNCNINSFQLDGIEFDHANNGLANNNNITGANTSTADNGGIYPYYSIVNATNNRIIGFEFGIQNWVAGGGYDANNYVLAATRSAAYGIEEYATSPMSIINNTIIITSCTYGASYGGINMGAGFVVANNTLTCPTGANGNTWGILNGGASTLIINNTISGYGNGIKNAGSYTNTTSNTITGTATGIYDYGVNNTYSANNVNTTGSYTIVLGDGNSVKANGCLFRNNTVTNAGDYWVIDEQSVNCVWVNNTINTAVGYDLYIPVGASLPSNLTIQGNNITVGQLALAGSWYNGISNVQFIGNIVNQTESGAYDAISLYAGAGQNTFPNFTIANNTIYSAGSGAGTALLYVGAGANLTNSQIINNTFIATAAGTNFVYLSGNSSNNTFYWNNFSNTSGYYVNDTNGSNFYNTSISGQGEGNIWGNLNSSVRSVGGVVSRCGSGWYIGNYPTTLVPYNNSTSNGEFSCNFVGCGDYAPLTRSVFTCIFTSYGYVSPMTSDGTVIHASTPTINITQYFSVVVNNAAICPVTSTASIFYRNGTAISSLADVSTGGATNTTPIVNTGIPIDFQVYANISFAITGIASVGTETRWIYIINNTSGPAGVNGTVGVNGTNGQSSNITVINNGDGTYLWEFFYSNGTNYANFTTSNLTGLQGIQGVQGPQGMAGINGLNGINGINGTNGLNGTIWYVAPTFPSNPEFGGIYLNNSTGLLYNWTGSTWNFLGNVGTIYSNYTTVTNITNNYTLITNITNMITQYLNVTQLSVVPGAKNTTDTLGIFAALIILLYLAAMFGSTEMKVLGVLASLLLLLMGIWISIAGITYKTGEIHLGGDVNNIVGNSSSLTILNGTSTTANFNQVSNITKNETTVYQYSEATVPTLLPNLDFSQIFGLSLILLSIFGMLYYGMQLYHLDDNG